MKKHENTKKNFDAMRHSARQNIFLHCIMILCFAAENKMDARIRTEIKHKCEWCAQATSIYSNYRSSARIGT